MMKHSITVILILCVLQACDTSAQKRLLITEEYCSVTENGSIDESTITEVRILKYRKGSFLSGEKIQNGEKIQLISNIDLYNPQQQFEQSKSYILKDKDGRIVMQRYLDGDALIVHNYSYNKWGDIVKDVLTTTKGSVKTTNEFTYEYFYLPEFTYATNDEGVTAVSGYVDNYESKWVKRTVRKDRKVIQHIQRRFSTY